MDELISREELKLQDAWSDVARNRKMLDTVPNLHPVVATELDLAALKQANADQAAKLDAAQKRIKELEQNAVVLPFKFGDTVYAVDLADCKLGNCPEVDTESCLYDAYKMPTDEVTRCRAKHAVIETLVVDQIDFCITEGEIETVINAMFFAEDCHETREEAEAALRRAEG